jgi:hypothetical protein
MIFGLGLPKDGLVINAEFTFDTILRITSTSAF